VVLGPEPIRWPDSFHLMMTCSNSLRSLKISGRRTRTCSSAISTGSTIGSAAVYAGYGSLLHAVDRRLCHEKRVCSLLLTVGSRGLPTAILNTAYNGVVPFLRCCGLEWTTQ